jgi:uncharacterized protein YgbK (DUF1537 family)
VPDPAASVPAPWPEDLLPELARRAAARPAVVLDDDPTGTQTLRDIPVLTAWDAEAIARHLDAPVVFLSTNSRSLDEGAAVRLTRDATEAALAAASQRGVPLSVVSRSDSTLRGHFPAEVLAVADAMGRPDARIVLAPYFGEGGRTTIDDVHRLERDGVAVPVAKTEFARDATFGYRSSDLRAWVAEKYATAGRRAPVTRSLPLDLVRGGGPDAVRRALRDLPPGAVAVANAATDRDIEVVALGALLAEEEGVPLVARTAASYVRARAGRAPAPLLSAEELATHGPGLVVVGSHVETTTRQLAELRTRLGSGLELVTLPVASLLAGDSAAVGTAAHQAGAALLQGRTAVIATERTRRDVDLAGGQRISHALVAVVRGVVRRPAWVLAKGGITSSDVAAHGLELREARVAGQLLPGVPVWIGGPEARWPGVPLVVFPGNVGGASALADAVETLTGVSG